MVDRGKPQVLSDKALQWALEYLGSNKNLEMVQHEKMVETSYSEVYKIDTPLAIFYLKQTPKAIAS